MNKVYGYDTNIYETSIGNIKYLNEEKYIEMLEDGNLYDYIKDLELLLRTYKALDFIQQENQQLKKQKDDVVEYIKSLRIYGLRSGKMLITKILNKILRMLGEIDVEDLEIKDKMNELEGKIEK